MQEEATLSVHLVLVQSENEIRQGIRTFNSDAKLSPDLARELARATWYWVLDQATGDFGPSKFIGFNGMHFEEYLRARGRDRDGSRFDGNVTRLAIEGVVGQKFSDDKFKHSSLEQWADRVIGNGTLGGISRTKWKFLVI